MINKSDDSLVKKLPDFEDSIIISQLEECLSSGKYEDRIVLMGDDGVQLIGKPAAMHILSIQEINGLMIEPHPIMAKQLRVWTGLSKTKMALLTGMKQNIQWSKFENKQKLISKEAWTLLQLRLGIHPKYKLVCKSDLKDE